jgi:molybdopterin-guanine dinucleotide biosynthesis protein
MAQPIIIGIGGFTSNVGKTTLLCELLKAFPGWEAIKTTRGHYRSCGKDPKACCVSHLLSEKPLVRSGRKETYELGKDTGRYWDAGATNVHWLICTDEQVEEGINQALARVQSPGVFIEGNSFSEFVNPDHFVMVRHSISNKIKSSARRLMDKATAIYVADDVAVDHLSTSSIPLFTKPELPVLIEHLRTFSERAEH